MGTDESTFYLLGRLTRIIAPKGSKPIQIVNSTKKKVIAYGTIDDNGKAECFFFENMKSESFIEFLEILKNIYGNFVLVLDGAPSHRSQKTRTFVEGQKGIFWHIKSHILSSNKGIKQHNNSDRPTIITE